MGVSRTVAELVGKLDSYAASIPDADRRATGASAQAVKNSVMPRMASATGGDMRLSGTGRTTKANGGTTRERQLGVRYTLRHNGARSSALVGAMGPAHLVERDVDRHFVFSRYARAKGGPKARTKSLTVDGVRLFRIDTRSASQALGLGSQGDRRAVLKFNGLFRRWTVASSKGRKPWERGVDAARGQVRDTWQNTHVENLRRSFR